MAGRIDHGSCACVFASFHTQSPLVQRETWLFHLRKSERQRPKALAQASACLVLFYYYYGLAEMEGWMEKGKKRKGKGR